jgi:hypothetical protein
MTGRQPARHETPSPVPRSSFECWPRPWLDPGYSRRSPRLPRLPRRRTGIRAARRRVRRLCVRASRAASPLAPVAAAATTWRTISACAAGSIGCRVALMPARKAPNASEIPPRTSAAGHGSDCLSAPPAPTPRAARMTASTSASSGEAAAAATAVKKPVSTTLTNVRSVSMVFRCRLPGPQLPPQTARLPVTCACAPAANAATSSCRTFSH